MHIEWLLGNNKNPGIFYHSNNHPAIFHFYFCYF